MKVVIPIEIGMTTIKTIVQDQRDNDEELVRHLDWVDEIRGNTTIWMASYHYKTIAYYNKNV